MSIHKTLVLRQFAIIILLLTASSACSAVAQTAPELICPATSSRTIVDFDRNWKFSKGDFPAGNP